MAQRKGRIHRRPQALGHRSPGVSEPAFVIQVIDRGEPLPALAVAHNPVVAPATHGSVSSGYGPDVPAISESLP